MVALGLSALAVAILCIAFEHFPLACALFGLAGLLLRFA
jgi:hypothetical protein